MLRCPNCHGELKREERTFRCQNGHSFDVARQGYVNLLVNARKETGDNKAMVKARTAFLEQGHYRCLRDALRGIVQELPVRLIADCGCGEGYYAQAAAEAGKEIFAFDMSKYALMKCARRHPDIHAFAASIYDLPLEDECVDMVMSIFAPFAQTEFLRVLKPGGYVLKVGPAHDHLLELKQVLYEQVYENHEETKSDPGMALCFTRTVRDQITVEGQEMIYALFQMTPYYYRSPQAGVSRLNALAQLQTRISFRMELYQKQ